ncbi:MULTISPECIES: acetyl-CoA carboxylase biotin carboxyl carrier protein [Helicobacter]|uniref:Biotin carboxyl carrier protein of acetyl-CoA carboxylase n=1 Tax=Helicobacter ibis TaxID=2962633 RepID=A0ABT4VFI0_9HELI|nr:MULTISPECIES: acetyl-CoA carboxylase biotin carboxyl carrier protein [Helicobacter]MDA3967747.1 acetyl-CoA carboxylase biotin carboxyl carrier protein [Helicobacter sp. WB40]MDA3969466.1 acetyl-CoA carboxylase biotin carboxyl carrier protein [Helicobacter ibis]
MDFKEIKELIKIFDSSSLSSLSITKEDSKIKLEKGGKVAPQAIIPASVAQAPQPQAIPSEIKSPSAESAPKTISGETINSPMVGTFYRCPSPNAPAYVNVGDKVKKGQTLAIIEAMKIMNEIEAEFDCVIKEILPSDAQPVEYNMPLFVVEKI